LVDRLLLLRRELPDNPLERSPSTSWRPNTNPDEPKNFNSYLGYPPDVAVLSFVQNDLEPRIAAMKNAALLARRRSLSSSRLMSAVSAIVAI
jgi:hypothetical protein